MLLDRMEYVTAASDADSIVWICLFTLSSSFMLSDLLLCFESLYYLPSLKKVYLNISHKPEPHC